MNSYLITGIFLNIFTYELLFNSYVVYDSSSSRKHSQKGGLFMLNAQVEYWKLQETKRHNLADEGWHNASLDESIRHNKMSEEHDYNVLQENIRHNKANEHLDNLRLIETRRSNKANESIGFMNASTNIKQADIHQQEADIKRDESYLHATEVDIKAKESPFNKFQSAVKGIGSIVGSSVALYGIL